MISRNQINPACVLSPPASSASIAREEAQFGRPLPSDYLDFVGVSNGLHTPGNLSLLPVEGVVARNADYEVQQYVPGYFMIGDDGGGIAILLNLEDRRVYEVGMGVMDERFMRVSAESIDHLLALGTSLGERNGW